MGHEEITVETFRSILERIDGTVVKEIMKRW